jgi:uncharacterized protein with GYD domain
LFAGFIPANALGTLSVHRGSHLPKEDVMPFFLCRASYSSEATSNLIHHPQHREDALRKSCEALGGKMHAFFFCFGEYDAMVLAELPDNKSAAALALSAEASGAVKAINTTVLLTVDEAMEAMKLAANDKYKPPK